MADSIKSCIALIFDKNLILPAAVLIRSISDHYFLSEDLDIVCCIPGESEEIFDKVVNLADVPAKINLKLVSINETNHPFIENLGDVKTSHWAPTVEFYKMFLGSLLPEYAKVLYLDTDMLIVNDIQPMLDHPLINNVMGVVDITGSELSFASINSDRVYFNNGVIIANLVWWRESKIEEQCVSHATGEGFVSLGSEELENIYVKENWHPLPFTFNFYQFTRDKNGVPDYDKSDLLPLHYRKAIAIHFGGMAKPWNFKELTRKEDKSLLGQRWRNLADALTKKCLD